MTDWIRTITSVVLRVNTPPLEHSIDGKAAHRQLLSDYAIDISSAESHRQHKKTRLSQILLVIVLLLVTNCLSIYVTRQAGCTKEVNV